MSTSTPSLRYPRITIEFCVQCKWNLRAAYFAQELLQTFSTSVGEISLIPVTGGVFTITLYHQDLPESKSQEGSGQVESASGVEVDDSQPLETTPKSFNTSVIWDRKRDGGFPETKELKNRVRNIIEPGKDMGHVDRALRKAKEESAEGAGRDGKQEGTGETTEKVEHQKGNVQTVSALAPETSQVEGGSKSVAGNSSHAEHMSGTSVVQDCEECAEAMKVKE